MRSHLYIAKKYFKSGWLLLDLLATFPFYMLNNVNGIGFKMIRMVRIPKIFNLVDKKRFDVIIDLAVSKLPREESIKYRHLIV
jgi:hypothetical protein